MSRPRSTPFRKSEASRRLKKSMGSAESGSGKSSAEIGVFDLVEAVRLLPEDAPVFHQGVWYRTQKEHWIGWASGYSSSGGGRTRASRGSAVQRSCTGAFGTSTCSVARRSGRRIRSPSRQGQRGRGLGGEPR